MSALGIIIKISIESVLFEGVLDADYMGKGLYAVILIIRKMDERY
jgi:hypothetical protein